MRRGDVLEIIYMARDGTFTKRRIRVIEYSETYVKAYCYTRRMVRIFNKDGILAHQKIRSA
jgi:predicted DNA-binding transcriptional regulator YafY